TQPVSFFFDFNVHARVHAPQRRLGARAVQGEVCLGDHDGFIQWRFDITGVAHGRVLGDGVTDGAQAEATGVSQWWYLGFLPVTTSKSACCSRAVTGPRLPAPMRRPSTSRIGVTSAADPSM